jgi:hypothetical protein
VFFDRARGWLVEGLAAGLLKDFVPELLDLDLPAHDLLYLFILLNQPLKTLDKCLIAILERVCEPAEPDQLFLALQEGRLIAPQVLLSPLIGLLKGLGHVLLVLESDAQLG